MKDIWQAAQIFLISRHGVVFPGEQVTIGNLPRWGVTGEHIYRPDMRIVPTPDLVTGIFRIVEKKKGKFTLFNHDTGIRLIGVPRRSFRIPLDIDGNQVSRSR